MAPLTLAWPPFHCSPFSRLFLIFISIVVCKKYSIATFISQTMCFFFLSCPLLHLSQKNVFLIVTSIKEVDANDGKNVVIG